MFAERIRQTSFTDPAVDSAFKIQGDDVCSDAVFKSVLRAVLPSRMGEDDGLEIVSRSSDVSSSTCGNENIEIATLYNAIYGSSQSQKNAVTIINMSAQNKIHERAYKDFATEENGWRRIERVSQFYDSVFDVVCFVNDDYKSTIVLMGRGDVCRLHYLLASTPAWLPWYFPKDSGLSAEERALFTSLRKTTKTDFMEALAALEKNFDFYSIKLQSLGDFETRWMRSEINSVASEIEHVSGNIKDYEREIARYLTKLEELNIRLNGLKYSVNEDSDGELRDYFLANKDRVRLTERDGDTLVFEVMTPLLYFDSDYAETLVNNKRSAVYTQRGGQPRMKSEEMGTLFRALFVDGVLKLRFCAAYKMHVSNREVYGMHNYQFGLEAVGYFPNPHINRYECLGAYRQALTEAMKAHNYIGVIEQCVVSCASLNMMDTTVIDEFMKRLYECNDNVIVLPNGETTTPCGAVEYLKSQQEEKEENEDGETD